MLSATLAQAQSATDSALVGRILLAEDRRDSTDAALTEGASHADARIRTLALRARARIRDPRFTARDSFPPVAAPKVWPEPAWRLRFRALAGQPTCDALRAATADVSWPVRIRAADRIADARVTSCVADDSLAAAFTRWVDALPATIGRRAPGNVTWHAAAHGIVALARLNPDAAKARMAKVATHRQWQVRMYAARAARALSDTATLRALVADRDANVAEVAIEGLSSLTGHADDELFLTVLTHPGAQAVRAAAIALKGSPLRTVPAAANATFDRWVQRQNASEKDVRVALLEAAGRPVTDDRPPAAHHELPRSAVALALGDTVYLRVIMDPATGGGSIVVRLRGDVAPMMAARVYDLARAGAYDNTTWHRVEHDFVTQGAGHGANEYVGYKHFFRDELGTIAHPRGTVGMSTRGHDTGDAQWFFNLRDNARLVRDYTVFAEVVQGIDVLDGIMEGDVVASIEPAIVGGAIPGSTGLLMALVFGTDTTAWRTDSLPVSVRAQAAAYRKRFGAYRTRRPRARSMEGEMILDVRLRYERMIAALVPDTAIRARAIRLVDSLRACYEWEGMSECPQREAENADRIVASGRAGPFASYLPLLSAHRWLCAAAMLDEENNVEAAERAWRLHRARLKAARRSTSAIVRVAADRLAERQRCW